MRTIHPLVPRGGVKSLRVRTSSRGSDGAGTAFESDAPHDASVSLVNMVREHLEAKRSALRTLSPHWIG